MKLSAALLLGLSVALFSCGEEPIPATTTTRTATAVQSAYNDTQTVFTYEPATSYLSGTIRKEVHFVPGGLNSTAKAVEDTAYALVLDKKIAIHRTQNTDPLSHDTAGISIIQLASRTISLYDHAGKKATIKGLLIQDPTPTSYYKMILVVQEIK